MSMFSALEISGSAMGAERQRAEVVATNMANAETTRTPVGRALSPQASGFFRRQQFTFSTVAGGLPASDRTIRRCIFRKS